METITIFVKEATSEKPIQELEALVTAVEGVERALVDITDGEVKISFDSQQVSEKVIIDKVQQEGFHVADRQQK